MPIDKDSLENLNREFELVVEREQKKLEEKLELELQGLRPSKPLTQEDKARVASNFWSRERPKMDAKIKKVETQMYQDYGGSKDVVDKQLRDYQERREKFRQQFQNSRDSDGISR